jgi:hypothetical protein
VIGADGPNLGDGGDTVNNQKLPEVKEWKNDDDLEKQLSNLEKEFFKAMGTKV